jgi:hypothetical protein
MQADKAVQFLYCGHKIWCYWIQQVKLHKAIIGFDKFIKSVDVILINSTDSTIPIYMWPYNFPGDIL